MSGKPSRKWGQAWLGIAAAALLLGACNDDTIVVQEGDACPVFPAAVPSAPTPVACNNAALTSYDELLIITPHPDDEVLGFAGLMLEFIRLNKPVHIVVVTVGDAYCDACSFWKNVGIEPSMKTWG